MKRYHGNEKVGPGVYFNAREISFTSMEEEGRLPGTGETLYRRVPLLALIAAGPLLGGVYLIFLPLIGFGMLAWVVGGRTVELGAGAAAAASRVLRPAWEPARAFLSRGKVARKARKSEDRWAGKVKKRLESAERTKEGG